MEGGTAYIPAIEWYKTIVISPQKCSCYKLGKPEEDLACDIVKAGVIFYKIGIIILPVHLAHSTPDVVTMTTDI